MPIGKKFGTNEVKQIWSITYFTSVLFFRPKINKYAMVNADTTTKEYSEQSERMRHLVVKSVLHPTFHRSGCNFQLSGEPDRTRGHFRPLFFVL